MNWSILGAMLVFFTASALAPAAIVPTEQLVAGRSYGEWTVHAWKWLLEMPYDANHPFRGTGGSNALRGQSGPLLHLFGADSPTIRAISIPDDRYLYVQILGLACTTLDQPPFQPATTNEADIRMCAESFVESDLFLEIDGVSVPNLEQYHHVSPLFGFDVPAINIFGIPWATNGIGVGAANGVILEPLSPGQHQIRFYGRYSDFNYFADVVYQITVYARPALSVKPLTDSGSVQFSWPAGNGFTLQQADSPGPSANWSNASVLSLEFIGDLAVATVATPAGNRFFRLNRPL